MDSIYFITKINTSEIPVFIKHSNMKDVCFMPSRVLDDGSKLAVQGIWVNIAYPQEPFIIEPAKETIKIKKDDLPNWSFI